MLDAFDELNYLAVLVAALGYFVVGAAWYSPALFSRPWMRLSGVQPSGSVAPLLALSLVAELLASLALAVLATAAGASSFADGIVLGLVCGLGFALTSVGVTMSFEGRPAALAAINIGYHLVGILVAAVIVTVWR